MFFNELIDVVSETALLFTVYGLVSGKRHSVGRRNYLVAVIVGLQGAIAGKVRIVELISNLPIRLIVLVVMIICWVFDH